MTQVVLPRYFVASAQAAVALTGGPPSTAAIEHCIDMLLWNRPGTQQIEELVVGVDRAGALCCVRRDDPALTARAQRELHSHELLSSSARRAAGRALGAERLFLFDMELVEQAGSGGELNQPVFVYGTLLGPLLPGAAPARHKGQLTLTRADVLEGLLLGQDWPFLYADEPGRERRHHHAFLPGGRAEELAAGRDLVIGYPRVPQDLSVGDPENAAVVQLLVGELAAAIRADLERSERAQNTLSRWFSKQRSLDLAVPQSHALSDWLQLAAKALSCLPDWPSSTAEAMRKATSQASHHGRAITPERAGVSSAPVSQPQQAVTPPSIPKRPTLLRTASNAPPDWSGDFLPEQHRPEPQSTYVSWKAPAPPAPKPSAPGDWMQDFASQTDPEEREAEPVTQPDGALPTPEWLKDFEDETK